MKAALIFIGSELLRGKQNKDADYLGEALDDLGVRSEYFTVSDDEKEINDIFQFAFPRADFIITVGGLGPTFDDRTIEAVCTFTGRRKVLSVEALRSIADYFINRGHEMPKTTERCAYVVSGAKILKNPVGFAPPQIVVFKKTDIIMLPGPPAELKAVFQSQLLPLLSKKIKPVFFRKKKLCITGLSESEVDERIKSVVDVEKYSGLLVDFTVLAHLSLVEIDFRVKGDNEVLVEDRMRHIEKEFRDALGVYIYGEEKSTLVSVCGRLLSHRRRTLSVAESCTGGEIANMITDVKGASAYFDAGAVLYTEREKCVLLGIPNDAIKKEGVVSSKVAAMMAEGMLKLSDSYYALSTTGVAGPGSSGGVAEGTVFIALAQRGVETFVKEFHFFGGRLEIKKKASLAALDMLRRNLLGI